jgi:hypothetical protein
MTDGELPSWAVRLRDERIKRLWSQKVMAARLRKAADERTLPLLPSQASIQRYVRWYEAGEHHPGELYGELYCRVFGLTREALFGSPPVVGQDAGRLPTEDDAIDTASWITATNTSDDAIEHFLRGASELAEAHTRLPAGELLPHVVGLHRQVQAQLRTGRQRFRQTRKLFRAEADLLAHACLLLGDLRHDRAAEAYGATAALCAQEIGASQAVALSAQAKTARWRRRYAESAELAAQGYGCSPATPIRIVLACQEANAAGLMGDISRARRALHRAEEAANSPLAPDSGSSAWSCPTPRRALYALSVATQAGEPDAALKAAELADAGWAAGDPLVAGTWAQIRVGAGIAHVMKGSLDGAAEEIAPMLTLAPELRMATITGYLETMDVRLRQRRFRHSSPARRLREQIQEFNAAALPTQRAEENV